MFELKYHVMRVDEQRFTFSPCPEEAVEGAHAIVVLEELSKPVADAMLAQGGSGVNSISMLGEKTGADLAEVARAIGTDSGIGPKFSRPPSIPEARLPEGHPKPRYVCESAGLHVVARYWQQAVENAILAQGVCSINSTSLPCGRQAPTSPRWHAPLAQPPHRPQVLEDLHRFRRLGFQKDIPNLVYSCECRLSTARRFEARAAAAFRPPLARGLGVLVPRFCVQHGWQHHGGAASQGQGEGPGPRRGLGHGEGQ